MNWIDKLERRFGRYGIPYLVNGLIIGQLAVGLFILIINWRFGLAISLDRDAVLHGQIWRLVTFLFQPIWLGSVLGILNLFFYFWIGNSLTRGWGDFRITLYILLGVVGTWIGAFLTGGGSPYAVYLSMMFAYCWMWPNQGVMLWGIIPFKMKYLGWFELAIWLWEFIAGSFATRISLVLGMAGFIAFFGREVFFWCKDTILGYKRRRDWQNRNNRW